MASFFGDLFNSLTNQQATPQQTIIPTNELLKQAYGTATGLSPEVIAYNQSLAPGLTNVQLGVEKQFDPNVANLRAATSKSILDELNLGGNLGNELQDQVIRNALEGNAATGFGVSQGGRGLVARDLGLTSLDLARSRRGEAQNYVRSSPSLSSLYQPRGIIDPGAIAQDIRGVQAAQDEYANVQEDIRRKNFSSIMNTGTRIIGGVVGGIYGGPMGAQAGAAAGGSVFGSSGVGGPQYGFGQQAGGNQGGGSPFSSILSGLFGGGGGGQAGLRNAAYEQGGVPLGSY